MITTKARLSIFLFCIACSLIGLVACKSGKQNTPTDTVISGRINVSADESFKPIVDELVKVYESYYPKATIHVDYKPEADCLNDMLTDSVRMIIATRMYNQEERQLLSDSAEVAPSTKVVARDAIAVVIHPSCPDSLLRMQDVRDILTGRFKKNLIPVFDGLKATSTVRFIIDSVLKGDALTSKAMAAKNSQGVIDYVAEHPEAIGFIGVSWIGNPEDPSQKSFLKKVNVAQLECTDLPGGFVKAFQANIYIRRYPMVRDLVYILKEKNVGLGNGFANFMSGEIGQLIFKRAYLAPVHTGLGIRPVQLNE